MEEENSETIYVLDTSALAFINSLKGFRRGYIAEETKKELRHFKTKLVFEALIHSQRLQVKPVNKKFLKETVKKANETGEYLRLSKTDLYTVALAHQIKKEEGKKVIVLTDDYTIQNLCEHMEIDWKPVKERGIRKVAKWELKCTSCGKIWRNTEIEICPICGGKLKKRMIFQDNGETKK